MKIFGYIDDGLKIAYHWFDFIQNDTLHKIIFVVILLIVLKIVTDWMKNE